MKLATTTEDFNRFCGTYTERIEQVHKAGFKYIDLSLYSVFENDELLISDDWRKNAEKINEYAKSNGIEFVQCHSPSGNPLTDGQFDRLVDINKRCIEICGILGIKNMVVHPGWAYDISKLEWQKRNKAFFERLFDTMEKNNVNVLHENGTTSNFYCPKTGADMREFSEYVNHPLFHSCWDTGHANIEGSQYDEILAIGDDLYAVHFNDNRGKDDEHMIPYFGTINVDEVMCALKDINFKGSLTFEAPNTLRSADFWVGPRRSFDKGNCLLEPTLEMQAELEKLMYLVGKHILTAYDEFEG